MTDNAQVLGEIAAIIEPVSGESLETLKAVKECAPDAKGLWNVRIALGFPDGQSKVALESAVRQVLDANGCRMGRLDIETAVTCHRVRHGLKPLEGVKNIIAVSSGKGGVGKSTVAANIALTLAAEGAKVGILDADIYGPSQPTLLGAVGYPEAVGENRMLPVPACGIVINSIGFLIDPEEPAVWRGPMVAGAFTQLVNQTLWGELDYLVVDMPPGTGDIQLTLSQSVPVAGAIIVTTPQDIAYLDAAKGLRLFEKLSVPILGIVENMALFRCPKCGHVERIFGEGAALKLANGHAVPVLGALELDGHIRELSDAGRPVVLNDPESTSAKAFRSIALKAAVTLSRMPKAQNPTMPGVRVEPAQ